MKTSNSNLDELRVRVGAMMQAGRGLDEIVKDLFDQPQAHIMQADGRHFTLLVSPDQKSYQMREGDAVLDEQPIQMHVLFLLQQLAISQFSELLLTEKLEETEAKVTQLEEIHNLLDHEKVERVQEGRQLDLWTRIAFFGMNCAKKREEMLRQGKE